VWHDDTKVIESRDVDAAQAVRRGGVRRMWLSFTTYERVERPQLVVVKKDSTRSCSAQQVLAGSTGM